MTHPTETSENSVTSENPEAPENPAAPTNPATPESPEAPAQKKDRRVLRAVLRWTAAVLVLAAAGAGSAYGVIASDRGDLPGLATESDGRWEYPRIERPPLPEGAPAPFAEGNLREEHFADLRALVLPAPKGAIADRKLTGHDGWLDTDRYLAEYDKEHRRELAEALRDGGLRHVAARGWTMPDGTRTRVYLLRFNSGAFARDYRRNLTSNGALPAGVERVDPDHELRNNTTAVRFTYLRVFGEQRPYGKERVRFAYIDAGDVMALVVQSDDGHTPAVPFHQTVALQNQLLG
ncbi:hypothetical protein ACFW9D_28400 [Streptomyces sp. NPDC059524]|uniref:hypothetical protein n=1 Tax=Streptomyces sp. NPDC059524 TaxID=3346856 RepID=UPI003685288A